MPFLVGCLDFILFNRFERIMVHKLGKHNSYDTFDREMKSEAMETAVNVRNLASTSKENSGRRFSHASGGITWMKRVTEMANNPRLRQSTSVNGGIVAKIDPASGYFIEEGDTGPECVTTISISPSGDRTTTTSMKRSCTFDENGQRTSIVQQRRVVVSKSTISSPVVEMRLSNDGELSNDNRIDVINPTPAKVVNGFQHHRTKSQPSTPARLSPRPSSDNAIQSPTKSLDDGRHVGDVQQQVHTDEMDLAIEAALRKTTETFQRMVDEEREQFVKMFPQLANSRVTTAKEAPGTETIIERLVEPDGTIVEVQKVITRQVLHVHKTVSMVNGIVQNSVARAVVEYQGPEGGYRVKILEGDPVPEADSETEEEEEGDRASIAPSEFSDTESVFGYKLKGRSSFDKRSKALAITSSQPAAGSQPNPKRKAEKAWYAAQELVESERRYVEKLRLLDQVFRTRVQQDPEASKTIGDDKLAKLFSNIGSLYTLHNEHLLPDLEQRLSTWQETRRICDVMRRLAPFLKIYSEYTSNYKKATKTFVELQRRNKRFAAIIEEIEKLPECDHLPLSNHIICPVQRVTRYHLLMTEYLKNLNDGHPDKEDTSHALELTKKAAAHANDMMRQLDKYKNVIEVQEMLGSQVHELLTPSRELVKQGRLMKISARNGEHQPRYVFLFSDMLLLCSDRRNVVISAWGVKYKLRAIFDVESMHVLEGDNLEVENTFYVSSGNKTVELYATSSGEKAEWMDALWSVIQDHSSRMQSFQKIDTGGAETVAIPATHATLLKKQSTAGRCSSCHSSYNAFRKAYACKSCDISVCKKCCQKKIALTEGQKERRVCNQCYEKMKNAVPPKSISPTPSNSGSPAKPEPSSPTGNNSGANSPDGKSDGNGCALSQRISRRQLLEVKPSDSCITSGYLEIRTNRKWDKRYFALHEDFVLYSFKSDADASAGTSMPITGCKVNLVDPRQDSTMSSKDANAFKLEQKKRIYYFKAQSTGEMARWMAALDLASQAQFPTPGA